MFVFQVDFLGREQLRLGRVLWKGGELELDLTGLLREVARPTLAVTARTP